MSLPLSTPTSSSSRSFTPHTPTSVSLKHRLSNIFNTPKRMNKRSNIPPPLAINDLTPPTTIRRMTYFNPSFLDQSNDSFDALQSTLAITTPLVRSNNTNADCCVCQDSLRLKGANEKVLNLECKHACHLDCYMTTINANNFNTHCFICNKESRPQQDNDMEEVYKYTLENGLNAAENLGQQQHQEDDFIPVQDESSVNGNSPHTPVNQIISDEDILNMREVYAQDNFISTNEPEPMPRSISSNDLIKPYVNLLSEFNKYNIYSNQEYFEISSLLNIFSSNLKYEVIDSKKEKEKDTKNQIHSFFIDLLSCNLGSNCHINLAELPRVSLFDSFKISVDGQNWETTKNFLFHDCLIIMNQNLDSIIGTALISKHLINLIEQEDSLILYFSTQTLPELQIKSYNKILLSKWKHHLTHLDDQLSLIKMSTNLWNLIINGHSGIDLPKEVIKFNELSNCGLDLPFEMIKSVLPRPDYKRLNLIVTIPLFNLSSNLADDEYLNELKDSLLNIIDNLKKDDKLGLVILGRDGYSNYSIYNSTFIGMFNKDYDGLFNIIDSLQLLELKDVVNDGILMNRCFKSCYNLFLTNSIDDNSERINMLMILTNRSLDYNVEDKYLIRLIENHNLSINEILIDQLSKCLVSLNTIQRNTTIYFNFRQLKYSSFKHFNDSIYQLFKKEYHGNYLNNIKVSLRINEVYKSFAKINKFEINGVMHEIPLTNELNLNINEINSGEFFKNFRFNLLINVERFKEFQDVPDFSLVNVNYSINHSSEVYHVADSKARLSLKHLAAGGALNDVAIGQSPILVTNQFLGDEYSEDENATEDEADVKDEDLIFLDIPLLPPLSSFKDSLFIKREIELLIIKELTEEDCEIKRLISVIFGLNKGCSSNYLNFFTTWKYKTFNKYIDEFILANLNALNKFKNEGDIMGLNNGRLEFINKLIQETD